MGLVVSVLVIVTGSPKIAVARESSDTEPSCETAAHVPSVMFFAVLAQDFQATYCTYRIQQAESQERDLIRLKRLLVCNFRCIVR